MVLRVWARDAARNRRGLLAVVDGMALLKENGVGTFTVTVEGNHPVAALFDKGWGLIIYDDDTFLASGPVERIRRSQRGVEHDLELAGVTDMHVLADRLVYPDPARFVSQQTTVYAYTATGVAETLLLNMVNVHTGPGAQSTRAVAGLTLPATQGRGPSTSVNARWTNLLDEVKTLCRTGGLMVDIGQRTGATTLHLDVRTSVDRSRMVRFTPGNGLGDHEVSLTAPKWETPIVGGGGTGTARTMYGISGSPANRWGGRRIETFLDRRDTTTSAELQKTAQESISEGLQQATATFEVTETARARYGVHYALGDTVTVEVPDGLQVVDRVTAAEFRWDGYGRTVRLTVGENVAGTETAPAWVRNVRSIERQMRRVWAAQ